MMRKKIYRSHRAQRRSNYQYCKAKMQKAAFSRPWEGTQLFDWFIWPFHSFIRSFIHVACGVSSLAFRHLPPQLENLSQGDTVVLRHLVSQDTSWKAVTSSSLPTGSDHVGVAVSLGAPELCSLWEDRAWPRRLGSGLCWWPRHAPDTPGPRAGARSHTHAVTHRKAAEPWHGAHGRKGGETRPKSGQPTWQVSVPSRLTWMLLFLEVGAMGIVRGLQPRLCQRQGAHTHIQYLNLKKTKFLQHDGFREDPTHLGVAHSHLCLDERFRSRLVPPTRSLRPRPQPFRTWLGGEGPLRRGNAG